jgi:hypothetical protein
MSRMQTHLFLNFHIWHHPIINDDCQGLSHLIFPIGIIVAYEPGWMQ